MKSKFLIVLFLIPLITSTVFAQKKDKKTLKLGFYNVENLFDIEDDPNKDDDEFTPNGKKHWTGAKFQVKLQQLAKVIDSLDVDALGLCEVENKFVIEELLKESQIADKPYKIVHFESRDMRGIDVAMLYDSTKMTLLSADTLYVPLPKGDRPTRYVLETKFKANKNNAEFYFFVNHWPSRYGGLEESKPKRAIAAQTVKNRVDEILKENPNATIILTGDFNDDPFDESLSKIMNATDDQSQDVFNAMYNYKKDKAYGSLMYKGLWNHFDLFLLSKSVLDKKSKIQWILGSEEVFYRPWLMQKYGKYKDNLLRCYGGKNFLGGYSDHLPVRIKLKLR